MEPFCIRYSAQLSVFLVHGLEYRHFRGAAAWDEVRHRVGRTGSPRLHGVIAVLECTVEHYMPGGDHEIVPLRDLPASRRCVSASEPRFIMPRNCVRRFRGNVYRGWRRLYKAALGITTPGIREAQTMATAARDRLARTLRGDAQTAFSVELIAGMDDLSLEVEGFGRVKFPVTPAKARKLLGLGRPARFGRGEETVTDPDVRDTWEIPKHLVRAEWNAAMLKVILATIKEELGLPNAAELTADLHSLLIYETNQHFLAHQDSEKDDSMVGTLVVTLPSSYTGGELMVGLGEEWKSYRGSKTALSLVAFYADCRHEVLRVKSGYRITLTYNLLLHGDTSRPEGDEGTVAELADLLREHFGTPVPRYYGGPAAHPPNRLVYLLDHEYTPRALKWSRLKGADASRVPLLRTAADKAGCEAILALADIKTTHSAFEDGDDDYGYGRGWDDEYDEDDEDDEYDEDDEDEDENSGNDTEYEIQEEIDSEVVLIQWTGPDGTRLEETSLSVASTEVCASTPTGDLKPYESEYEGYMGNWGNTLDRWYHRAAVVLWPREQAFANRAETSPAWALDELAAMVAAGDVPGARAAAGTLAPFWDSAVRGRTPEEGGRVWRFFGKALRAAGAVADADTAAMLLHPFRIENLTDASVDSFGKLAGEYGQQWTAELLRTWFGGQQPTWAYSGGAERPRWVADSLPGLCAGLHGAGGAGTVAAQRLLDLAWEWLGKDVRSGLGLSPPSYRDKQLGDLGKPLASVLTAATAIGAASTRDTVCGYIRQQPDAVVTLEISALRAAATRPGGGERGDAGFGDLAADCAARLRTRLARPRRASGDWSIELPEGCTCDLCDTLRAFGEDKSRRTLEWPLAKDGRQHVHSRINAAELPVTHVTRRQGRPYTLVLNKTDALFAREQEERDRDETDLEWLAAEGGS
jgi:predicted 2-oxoglutarate/Fe(II)-dependent dioxygenase YbiX